MTKCVWCQAGFTYRHFNHYQKTEPTKQGRYRLEKRQDGKLYVVMNKCVQCGKKLY